METGGDNGDINWVQVRLKGTVSRNGNRHWARVQVFTMSTCGSPSPRGHWPPAHEDKGSRVNKQGWMAHEHDDRLLSRISFREAGQP